MLRFLYMSNIEIQCDDAYKLVHSAIDREVHFFRLCDTGFQAIDNFYEAYSGKVSDKFLDTRYRRLIQCAYDRKRILLPKTCKN